MAEALRVNTVILIFKLYPVRTCISIFFSQTLKLLSFNSNDIGDKGAEYMAGALRNNKVLFIFEVHLSD